MSASPSDASDIGPHLALRVALALLGLGAGIASSTLATWGLVAAGREDPFGFGPVGMDVLFALGTVGLAVLGLRARSKALFAALLVGALVLGGGTAHWGRGERDRARALLVP